jgi:hypothetical protein
VKVILSYLLSQNSIDSSSARGTLAVGKALVDSHCGRCHALDRIYESSKTPAEWDAAVTRMVKCAHGTEGFFKPGEAQQIVRFLSAPQTPEALQARAAAVPDAVPDTRFTPEAESAERRLLTLPTIGMTVLIAEVFGILIRRPRTGLTRGEAAPPASIESRTPPGPTHGATMILQLVRSERQTHDCICLRLRIAGPHQPRIDCPTSERDHRSYVSPVRSASLHGPHQRSSAGFGRSSGKDHAGELRRHQDECLREARWRRVS